MNNGMHRAFAWHVPLLFISILLVAGTVASNVVTLTSSNFEEKVMNSDAPWIVAFVAPWCGHCQRLHPDYEKAADSLGGVVNVGRVNCDDEQQLAVRFGVKGFPTIKLFNYGKAVKTNPEDYQGPRTAKSIVDYALTVFNAITDPVTSLSDMSAVDAFLGNDAASSAKAVLFSSKSTNPSLWKSIAIEFGHSKKMHFAFVHDAHREITEKFGVVDKSPLVVVVPPGGSLQAGMVVYPGPLKKAELVSFLSTHLPASQQSSSNGGAEDGQEKPSRVFSAKAPPVFVFEPLELEDQKQLDEQCGSTVCVIGVVTSEDDKKLFTNMTTSYEKQLRIVFVRVEKQATFVNSFNPTLVTTGNEGDSTGTIDLIVLRAAKKKYARVSKVTLQNAPNVLESVLYGGLKFANLRSVPQLGKPREEL